MSKKWSELNFIIFLFGLLVDLLWNGSFFKKKFDLYVKDVYFGLEGKTTIKVE